MGINDQKMQLSESTLAIETTMITLTHAVGKVVTIMIMRNQTILMRVNQTQHAHLIHHQRIEPTQMACQALFLIFK